MARLSIPQFRQLVLQQMLVAARRLTLILQKYRLGLLTAQTLAVL